jgi:predicted homoserine dehydrogenase-like protein
MQICMPLVMPLRCFRPEARHDAASAPPHAAVTGTLMRVGFIGIGRIGSLRADGARRHPDVTALVLADQDPDRASYAASRLGCETADRADELLKSGVDAVVIAEDRRVAGAEVRR